MFERRGGGRVKIAADVLAIFRRYRQLAPDAAEAGGILLGRRIRGSSDLIVDEATEPGRGDRRSRYAFVRARARAQRRVIDAWEETEGTRCYLGEWHTHPEADPVPSALDQRERLRLLASTQGAGDSLLFAIVGQARVRVWEGNCRSGIVTCLSCASSE